MNTCDLRTLTHSLTSFRQRVVLHHGYQDTTEKIRDDGRPRKTTPLVPSRSKWIDDLVCIRYLNEMHVSILTVGHPRHAHDIDVDLGGNDSGKGNEAPSRGPQQPLYIEVLREKNAPP